MASSFKKQKKLFFLFLLRDHKSNVKIGENKKFNYNFIAMGEDNFQKLSRLFYFDTVNTLWQSDIYHFTVKFVDINLKILIKMLFHFWVEEGCRS